MLEMLMECIETQPHFISTQLINLLAPELFFFLILAHPVYKM